MKDRLYIATVTESAADVAAEYGLGLEIDEFCTAENMDEEHFEQVDKEVCAQIGRVGAGGKRKNGLPGVIFHAPFNELFPAAIDKKVLAVAYERYEEACRLAKKYGTTRMVVHSGFVPTMYFKEWHIDRSVEFWQRYMSDKPSDFKIYIENVLEQDPYIMAELFARLKDMQDTENIRMCLDVGHANYESDIDIMQWIKVTAQYIGHVHLHNNDGDWDYHQSLEKGSMDMRRVLDAIGEHCCQEITYTLETLPCRESVIWLEKNRYI